MSSYVKIKNKKIGVNNLHTTDGWGWFVDPETNYVFNNTSKYNQMSFKYLISSFGKCLSLEDQRDRINKLEKLKAKELQQKLAS